MRQVFYEKLPTNTFRAKYNLHVQNTCPFEWDREKTIIYILRDCEIAKRVWFNLINHTNSLYYSIFLSGFFFL